MRAILFSVILVAGCGPSFVDPPPVSEPAAPTSTIDSDTSEAPCPACARKTAAETPDTEAYRRSPWLDPAARGNERLLDIRVTDQAGTVHNLADLCDRPTMLSFLYTRCTNPNKCPRVVSEMAKLHTLLEAQKLDTQVRQLIMTYDPEYDTPARLKQFGEQHGLQFTPNVMMLQPDLKDKARFFDKLQVAVNYDAAGVNLHGVQLFLFDRQGRFVRHYQSVFWENQEVLDDLKRLTREMPDGVSP